MLYSVCILHSDQIHNNIGIHVNVECEGCWTWSVGILPHPRDWFFFYSCWNFLPIWYFFFACTGEYIVNREPSLSLQRSTVPCPDRLPSCIGLSDGKHEFPSRRWWADYIVCYHNRTVEINKCANGYFNPYLRICVRWISLSKIFSFPSFLHW